MEWLGQYIQAYKARFRNDVYLEDLTTTTETSVLVVDSAGLVSKSTSVAGDLTSIVAGTGLSGTSLTGPIPTINIDAAQPTVTSLGTLTALTGGTGDLIWNTNTLVVDTSEGNVGIGTTSPSEKLHVVGDALITGDSLADAFKPAAAGEPIKFKNFGGTERARILDGGNVGIGTTNPLAKLDVRGSTTSNSASGLIVKNSAGNTTLGVRDDGVVQVPTGYFWAQHASGMYSTGSIKARGGITNDSGTLGMGGNGNLDTVNITSAGNVGIGITAPTQALHLPDSKQIALGTGADLKIQHNGTNSEIGNSTGQLNIYNHADNSDINFMADDDSGGLLTYFFLDGSAKTLEYRVPLNIGVNDAGHDFTLYGDTANYNMMWDASSSRLEVNDNVKFNFGTGNDLSIYHTGSHSNIEASGTGDLKITQATDDQDIIFQCDDGSGGVTAYLTLDGSTTHSYFSAGNVGIGTSSPSKLLHISQTADSSGIRVTGHDNENNSHLDLYVDNFGNDYITSTEFLGIHSGGSARLRASNGYLRLESYSANNQIQIDSGYIKMTTSGAEAMRIDTSGNVGIGTTSPQKTLDVAGGDIRLDNSKGIYFSTVDANIGRVSITGDESNDFIRLKVDNNNSHVINLNTTGVGVGTTSPASKLHVAGTVQVGVDDTGHDVVFHGATSGKKLTWDESADGLYFADDTYLRLGDGGDVKMWHNGTDSYMMNLVGDLHLLQSANDKDIILSSDNGSGGTTAYLTLDGSAKTLEAAVPFNNSSSITSGGVMTSTDFKSSATTVNLSSSGSEFAVNLDDSVIIYGAGFTSTPRMQPVTTNEMDLGRSSNKWKDLYASGEIEGGSLDINGAADISGNTQLSGTLTVGVDDTGHDVKFYGATSGKYMLWDESDDSLNLTDSAQLKIGASADLRLYHDGSDSYVRGYNHDLIIMQDTADKDIKFKADDGSGGTTTYLTLDGSQGFTTAQKNIRFADDVKAEFGNDGDLKIDHDSSGYGYVQNMTGHLYLANYADDKDIIFQSDDGSGGVETYFFLDGSTGRTIFPDDKELRFGTGSDLNLYHNGTSSFINNMTGDLNIRNYADDKDIIFQSDDGSGGVATYLTLDGGFSVPYVALEDSAILALGTHKDLLITHDGTSSKIDNMSSSDLKIRQFGDDKDIIFYNDNGSGGTTAYLTLDGSAGHTVANKEINFEDNVKATFGTAADLDIYHNGTDTFFDNANGNMKFVNYADDKDIIFYSDDGSGGLAEYFRLDGGDANGTLTYTKWADNSIVALGAGKDLRMYHNGTNSIIQNYTGNLSIRNGADDGDIIFDCDDGSGDLAEYFRLDGGYSSPQIIVPDNVAFNVGSGLDFNIIHDGSNTTLTNNTGNLTIKNNRDDSDIIFQSDDGSGGTETYFFLDGSLSSGNPYTVFPDDSILTFGNSQDLQFKHSTNSYIDNTAGADLVIRQFVNDKDIIFQSDDGSGGVETYFYLDGSANVDGNPRTKFPDGSRLIFGDGDDVEIYHNSVDSWLRNNTGDLKIVNYADDKDIILYSDDGSGGVTPYLTLDGSLARTEAAKDILFLDDVGARFGNSADLLIYHDGTDSHIDNLTSDLTITNKADDKDIIFQCDDGSGGVTPYLTLDGGDATIVVAKPLLINGAAIQASPNLYGSTIKLLPSDFAANDDGGNTKFGVGYVDHAGETTYGMRAANSETELYAFVSIPEGMKATHVDIFDRNSVGVIVYEAQINATTMVSKGTGNANTTIDITDVNATATNFLAIQVTTIHATNSLVHGGSVTIAAQ